MSSGIALVTGASRGIGRAIAVRLAKDGYEVHAVARDRAHLDALCSEIALAGGKCEAIPLDLTDATAISDRLGLTDVDVLVNNAGVGTIKPFAQLSADEWNAMMNLNINALFYVTQAVLGGMVKRKRGQICTIGSIGGRNAWVGGAAYGATKAFVTAWSESLMLEVREHGIKVSVVMPGGVATEFGGHTPSDADAWKLSADDVANAVSYVLAAPGDMLVHRLEVRTNNVPKK